MTKIAQLICYSNLSLASLQSLLLPDTLCTVNEVSFFSQSQFHQKVVCFETESCRHNFFFVSSSIYKGSTLLPFLLRALLPWISG